MPTLRALECLLAVVDAASVTGAARALHASQPAVSHQLAALESEVGVPLLERLPRGVRPTAAGRRLVERARVAVTAADEAVLAARDERLSDLRVGCAESFTASLLAPALADWWAHWPPGDAAAPGFALTEGSSADDLAAAVRRGDLDVAVCPRPSTWPGVADVVGHEELVVVCWPGHRFAGQGSVDPADLDGEDAVGLVAGSAFDAWVSGRLAEAGARARVRLRTRQIGALAPLALAGLGVAVVPTTAIPADFTGPVRPFSRPLQRDVVALRRTTGDPLAERFVEVLVARGVPRRP
ncbi:LysR family transcriptional regulator [Nocardioides bruguierae]|uniref:LysR family transcriptional regulator n=1 Tax=Nocardioides bruguierae TaxID=2945102 RepID=UPI002021C2BA|nr:LysR family transcriptional regulator [Nocardioides bruguierae]MCL8025344.1 LysR family transcriptional regulator [Nocardioides bruguierae]